MDPHAGVEQAAVIDLLSRAWGIRATDIQPLGGELDASLRVDAAHGQRFCLKGRRVDDAGDSVGLELATIGHVAAREAELVPSVRRTTEGATTVESGGRVYWLLDWIEGRRWVDLTRPTPVDRRVLGATAARLQRALRGFDHAAAERSHHWDLRRTHESIRLHLDQCRDGRQRVIADKALRLFEERVDPRIDDLPRSVVHQDLNDFNLIVRPNRALAVIDFGDVLASARVTELAVAAAYAMLRTPRPVDALVEVAGGWFDAPESSPVDGEVEVLFPLAFGRLVVNALTWAARADGQPEYSAARSSNTWATLDRLVDIPADVVAERIRRAAGRPSPGVVSLGGTVRATSVAAEVIDLDPRHEVFDGVEVTDSAALWAAGTPATPFVLDHDQVRIDWGSPADGAGGPATIQLGAELHLGPGVELSSPVRGTVVEVGRERVVIDHGSHWSVWGGATPAVAVGDVLQPGGSLFTTTELPTTVHLLGFAPAPDDQIPLRVTPTERSAWASVCADPVGFLGFTRETAQVPSDAVSVAAMRNDRLASSQRYYYDEPMHLVRATGVTFVDSNAHHYLDVINNVTHVGHGNPNVVAAATRQMQRLNTNSRFLYEEMGRYADRLVERLPDPLQVVFLVCTGSEANDLAIRIARQVTARSNVMVIEGAYHGNTGVVTGISPNRYRGPGGDGPPPTTHEVQQPNRYRGEFGPDHPAVGERYADDVARVVDRLVAADAPPAAFIAESLMGTAGQIVHPDGYLAHAFAHVRAAGGLCISDEVQVGFGRLGDGFWGFERSGVVPDIVTMGKPMANGHPVAAVVTTRAIADAFDQGMKYFNTFGGNPVSCATANAVLDEIDRLDLQHRSADVGEYFRRRLEQLMTTEERIGDVRGVGLYLGVEFVLDRTTKEPAKQLTTAVCERLREYGVVMYPNGDFGNCLKIKPPMVFGTADVDRFVDTLRTVLDELT